MTGDDFEQRKAEADRKRAELFDRPDRGPDFDANPEQKIRNQIEAVKQRSRENPNLDVTDQLRRLRKQHYELTGGRGD